MACCSSRTPVAPLDIENVWGLTFVAGAEAPALFVEIVLAVAVAVAVAVAGATIAELGLAVATTFSAPVCSVLSMLISRPKNLTTVGEILSVDLKQPQIRQSTRDTVNETRREEEEKKS